MYMNILVVGSGGRESAIAWKLEKEGHKVFSAPGNGGSRHNVFYRDYEELANFAEREGCFTVIGPEGPLSEGIVDLFHERELAIFGPTQKASFLETSKAFAKRFMKKHRIPTAKFKVFSSQEKAEAYVSKMGTPIVIKASGLAAGKGVFVCQSEKTAMDAIDRIMEKSAFGEAGKKIIIEQCLEGFEISLLAFTDGRDIVPLEMARDYKRAFDGDAGPNTGGMGSFCPFMFDNKSEHKAFEWQVKEKITRRFLEGLEKEKLDYRGVIYFGLMVCNGEPYVLEFNCRFGDPETQAILPRMKSSLLPYLKACHERKLKDMGPIKWKKESSLCLVLASKGYPGPTHKGKEIKIGKVKSLVFHAATIESEGKLVTSGGRVINIVALGKNLGEARKKAYEDAKKISFEGKWHRGDIGQ